MRAERTERNRGDIAGHVGGIVDAYARWAPIYDLVFGPIMEGSRRAAIAALPASAHRVLEVGVGTGISLTHYPRSVRITGIDLSPHMLDKARERVRRDGLGNVERLAEMDAAALEFPDRRFDAAMAMYVMTVVPDPDAVMAELRRVVVPGGRIMVVSHFGADGGLRGALSSTFSPLFRYLGWNSSVTAGRIAEAPGVRLLANRPAGLSGFYRLLEFEVLD